MQDIRISHRQRQAAIDPLTAHIVPAEPPALVVDGALGWPQRIQPDPASLDATWTTADEHRLTACVTDPAAMDRLLTQWRRGDFPDNPDSSARVIWPSRDAAMTPVFLRHGLVATTVLAVRLAGRPTYSSGVPPTRPAVATDLATVVALRLQEIRWDEQFGGIVERPSTEDRLREVSTDWAWIAEVDGRPAGIVKVSPPAEAGWIADQVTRAPAAYLDCLAVDEAHRGHGVGAALAATAHAALDEAGVAVTLLHYEALNPLSVPFWHRQAYRPLWTTWQARPASAQVP